MKTSLSTPKLVFHWHKSVNEIKTQWADCFGQSHDLKSIELQKTIEEAALPDVAIHHLVVEDDGALISVIPCYKFKLSLVGVSSSWIQNFVGAIQKVFPGFLMANMFVVGSAISIYGDLLGFKNMQDSSRWTPKKLQAIFKEITRKARALGLRMIIVKEMEDQAKTFLEQRLDKQMFYVESLPLASLSVSARERGGYLNSIRTRYRNKLKKRKSVSAEHGLSWEIIPTMKGHEEEIYSLYQQVMQHAEQIFERLNKEFFVKAGEFLEQNSFYVCGYQKTGETKKLVSCEFVVRRENTLHALYSGFDYTLKQDSDMYFNAFYAIIEDAERLGCTQVSLGQTCYEVKAELGCAPTRLWVGVYHTNPVIRAFLKATRQLFFPKVKFPQRDVFATPPAPKKTGRKTAVEQEA